MRLIFIVVLFGLLGIGGYMFYTVRTVTHDPAVWHVEPLEVPPSDPAVDCALGDGAQAASAATPRAAIAALTPRPAAARSNRGVTVADGSRMISSPRIGGAPPLHEFAHGYPALETAETI